MSLVLCLWAAISSQELYTENTFWQSLLKHSALPPQFSDLLGSAWVPSPSAVSWKLSQGCKLKKLGLSCLFLITWR